MLEDFSRGHFSQFKVFSRGVLISDSKGGRKLKRLFHGGTEESSKTFPRLALKKMKI